MRIGLNTFLLTSPFTNRSTRLFDRIKKWGFDTVEIAIEDPGHINPARVRRALDDSGLQCGSICGTFGPDRDLRGSPAQQKNSMNYMKAVLDQMEELGAKSLVGPLYSSVGHAQAYKPAERRQQWRTVVGNLQRISDYAGSRGRQLCLEPLNRFETDFINTCAQALEMIRKVNHPALKLMLDTFHMNIEEKDPAAAIRAGGALLAHLHACGSDRGTPGGDKIDWISIASALKRIRYKGDVVVESFTPGVAIIAKAASIWRQIEPSEDALASTGLKFLRRTL